MRIDYTQYNFRDALLPKQYTICGVNLKPLCLGHICLLEQRGNPFIGDVKNINVTNLRDSLFEALLICSMTYEDAYKFLNSPRRYKALMTVFSANLLVQMVRDPNWNLLIKKNQFINYMQYYLDMPAYDELHETKNELPSGTDWKTSITTTFHKFNYTLSKVLNLSTKMLFYLWTSHIESEGAVTVRNKYDFLAKSVTTVTTKEN